jgi:sugar O-acyltransferase (sialic acid O-acetyltransferase NeuD family)
MENLIIVGAGGLGRLIHSQCKDDGAFGKEWKIKGFLDDRKSVLDGYKYDVGIIGDPDTYKPQTGDIFVVALGDPAHKERYAAPLLKKGAKFINLCTEITRGDNVVLGKGGLFQPKVYFGSDIVVEDFVTIASLTIIGHDVRIGAYSHISTFVMVGGWVTIGPRVTIHPHCTILPKVKIGEGATVGAGSVVVRDVPPGITVMGNPAKRFDFK